MKEKLGQILPSYPMPVALIGAMVNGKPNFMTAAWFTIVNYDPPMLGIVVGTHHYTTKGIRASGEFSVCIPDENMAKVTDYAGLFSGDTTDKSGLFELFQGETQAPLVSACPVCIECTLIKSDANGQDDLLTGKIIQVYADTDVMPGGKFDLSKIKPLIFGMGENYYYKLGDKFEKAWSCGKDYK